MVPFAGDKASIRRKQKDKDVMMWCMRFPFIDHHILCGLLGIKKSAGYQTLERLEREKILQRYEVHHLPVAVYFLTSKGRAAGMKLIEEFGDQQDVGIKQNHEAGRISFKQPAHELLVQHAALRLRDLYPKAEILSTRQILHRRLGLGGNDQPSGLKIPDLFLIHKQINPAHKERLRMVQNDLAAIDSKSAAGIDLSNQECSRYLDLLDEQNDLLAGQHQLPMHLEKWVAIELQQSRETQHVRQRIVSQYAQFLAAEILYEVRYISTEQAVLDLMESTYVKRPPIFIYEGGKYTAQAKALSPVTSEMIRANKMIFQSMPGVHQLYYYTRRRSPDVQE